MARLQANTRIYGAAYIDSTLVLGGNADLSGGNVSIGSGNTSVTSIILSSSGNLYTASPTVTISAPTTFGGATATANANIGVVSIGASLYGGAGYSVGNILTMVSNGAAVANATFTVTSVGNSVGGSGNITGLSITTAGIYTIANANPITFTSSTGSGANANVYYGVLTPTMTYNGVGYVEPATVAITPSSGGGSGAAGTPYIGSSALIRSLGGLFQFNTPQGLQLVVGDTYAGTIAGSYIQIQGRGLGAGPIIRSGSAGDPNAGINIASSGTGSIGFGTANGGTPQVTIFNTTSAVNYLGITGATTGNPPSLSAQGTDTNISLAVQTKGTGAIDLAAGSGGVNISNGGTVTAITGTNIGSSYTSFPSVVISAPTTAGGVQATASVAGMISNNPVTIVSGGTGYTVGDTLTVIGGTSISGAATLTVNSVSAGVITVVFNLNFAGYTVLPTNPVSVTGGTGTGATFNLTYSLRSASGFTITNAGSGYVEQPTVSFSGGGGSGAAAYAVVGTTATIKGLYGGSSAVPLQFSGPSGALLQIMETGTTSAPSALVIKGANGSNQIYPNGSNASLIFSSNGTGPITFYTNTLGAQQLNISHTASAVNYVQVTGAATGAGPSLSAQGTDTNISLQLTAKGTGNVYIASNVVVTGNVSVNGNLAVNGPAFSTYLLTGQTVVNNVGANVIYNGKVYDTTNSYNTSTGVFKPNIAGYYQFNWSAGANTYPSSSGIVMSTLYKNTTEIARGARLIANTGGMVSNGSTTCYLNGTTDFVIVYFLQGSSGSATLEADSGAVANGGSYCNYFNGSMIRGA